MIGIPVGGTRGTCDCDSFDLSPFQFHFPPLEGRKKMEVGYLTILFRDVFYRHNRPRWRLRGTILIALFLFGHVTDFSLLTRLISSLGTRTSIEEFSREEKNSIESFLRHTSPSNCTAERGRKFGLRNSAL